MLQKRYIFIIVTALCIAGISYAQDDPNDTLGTRIHSPITKSGSAAWMFTVSGLDPFGMSGMEVGSFQNPEETGTQDNFIVVGAGGKWFIADDLAIRALLGFTNSSEGDADVTKFSQGKTTTTIFGIAGGIEMHTHPVYSTSPYFGGQVSLAFGGDNNTRTEDGTTTESKSSGTAIGVGVFAGFDWYFTNAIAIGGEYMFGFNSTSLSETSAGKTTDLPSSSRIGIGSGSVHLIVHM
jgi:hypothetical protein